ncbi:spermidine/putrescine ABC transporter substrate-binding protein, partial [Streptomyces sp. TRM76130]|nr:spermidine/putrescine ABC transporter substrate-binding protein [Streptomyces sp. TRM76130]
RTGITVTYTEDINDNNEFFGKIRPQLAAGQDTGRDLIVLTDWLAARLIRLGWVQKLDPAHLPHAFANLSPQF